MRRSFCVGIDAVRKENTVRSLVVALDSKLRKLVEMFGGFCGRNRFWRLSKRLVYLTL